LGAYLITFGGVIEKLVVSDEGADAATLISNDASVNH